MFFSRMPWLPLLLIGAVPVAAEPLQLSQPLRITNVIRCSTKEALVTIIDNYTLSVYAGDTALLRAYSNEKMSATGLRVCNPVEDWPLFIDEIEVLGSPTTVINELGEETTLSIARVRLGISPERITDTGYITLPKNMYQAIFGDPL